MSSSFMFERKVVRMVYEPVDGEIRRLHNEELYIIISQQPVQRFELDVRCKYQSQIPRNDSSKLILYVTDVLFFALSS